MNKTNKRLPIVLNYAYDHVPYFNHICNAKSIDIDTIKDINSLTQLPLFSKDTIIEYGYANFISNEYLDNDGNIRNKNNKIRVERTSGTTQKSMDIVWNRTDYLNSVRSHWSFRWKVAKITPLSMMLSAISMGAEKEYHISDSYIYLNADNLSDQAIINAYDLIIKLKAEWIYTFGSIAYVFIRKLKHLGLQFPPSIRYIELIGEPLLNHYKDFIEKESGVTVVDCYGCVETNGISYTCEKGNHHLLTDNVFVEIVKNGKRVSYGMKGNVCVTSMHNKAMPMIRYMLNDIAEMFPHNMCSCGSHTDFIKIYTTRLPKILIMDDCNIFSKASLYFAFEHIQSIITPSFNAIPFRLEFNGIHKYKLIFDFKLVEQSKIISKYLSDLFQCYGLKDLQFDVEFKQENTAVNGFLVVNYDY